MKIIAKYSIKNGEEVIKKKWSDELKEVISIIETIDANNFKTKKSLEKTMKGTMLYSPKELNEQFKKQFTKFNWKEHRITCEYEKDFYCNGYIPPKLNHGAFREIDFVKNKLGIEIQLGKYAFMVYNVCAKMTIFHKHDIIEAGIEIVPSKRLQEQMSTGVSYVEQFIWDLKNRGEADIDIPVLILGIEP